MKEELNLLKQEIIQLKALVLLLSEQQETLIQLVANQTNTNGQLSNALFQIKTNQISSAHVSGGQLSSSNSPFDYSGAIRTGAISPPEVSGANRISTNSPTDLRGANRTPSMGGALPVSGLIIKNNTYYAPVEYAAPVGKIKRNLLGQELSKYMVGTGWPTINRVAAFLEMVYKDPKAYRQDVKKVTGLTDSGASKFVKMVRNRGLIVKIHFQHYVLTDVALAMIQKSIEVA